MTRWPPVHKKHAREAPEKEGMGSAHAKRKFVIWLRGQKLQISQRKG